ncbi:hypothetical protein G6O67_004688 [Ophiocordyceps sinensis]|uniref:Uncharacterized protein n=1 Tax=Ophiocordyceps sinensis TaxID=72228 RepID=A0A8H4PPY6_9HYPO|nr:hypothetical protein G6O67_004688 [Ophiocordyceps sinensis]
MARSLSLGRVCPCATRLWRLALPPRRLIDVVEVHGHAQETHVHIGLVRQVAQQDLHPRPKRRSQLPQPLLQHGELGRHLHRVGAVVNRLEPRRAAHVSLLPAGKVGNAPAVEPVDRVSVVEHEAQNVAQLRQVRGAVVLVGAVLPPLGSQEALVRNVIEIALVRLDEVVERAVFLVDALLQLAPRRLNHLKQNVVLQLAHKVNHLGQHAARRLPRLHHHGIRALQDAPRARHALSPRGEQRKLDPLDPPQKVEYLEVLSVPPFRHHHVDGRVDFVFEGEAVPANVAVRQLQHARIEAPEHLWRVVLRIGAPDRVLQLRGEGMAILGASRPIQVRRQ